MTCLLRVYSRDNLTDHLLKRGDNITPDLADPFIPLLDPVSPSFAGEGQHHLPRSSRLGDNSQRYGKIPDRVLSRFNGLDGCKGYLLWRQEVL